MDKITFDSILKKNAYSLDENQYALLVEFVELINEWNTKINLISRKDAENIWQKHILGSLSLLFTHQLKREATIVDVGTGGGFPGIPLAICLPTSLFMLVDSIQKKINVVNDVIDKLELPNANAFVGRAEELNMKAVYNRKFDYVTARAVGPIADIVGWTKMFLRTTGEALNEIPPPVLDDPTKQYIAPGAIIIFKGGDITAELEQLQIKLKPKSVEVFPHVIAGIDPMEFLDKKIVIVRP